MLLVEDDSQLVELLSGALRDEGYAVDVATDGQRGLHLGLTRPYDVVVIDRLLPALDGLDLLVRLRSRAVRARALILTALGTVHDRIDGLDAGADDYLVKPFDLDELSARLRALCRRTLETTDVLRIGAGLLDVGQREVVLPDGERVSLSAREFGLLRTLAAQPDVVHTRASLRRVVFRDAFAVLMLTFGRKLFGKLGERVEREGRMGRDMMALVLFVVLVAGWFTDYIGVFSVFGGFITGLAMPQSATVRRELETRLTDLNSILLLPVFFAFTGLNTQVSGFGAGGALWWPLAVIMAAAFAGKYLGCAAVVRVQGFSWRYASAVGGLMNARGLMILMFINIGLAHDMVTPELFAILVAVAIVTTAAAMPIYRASLPDGMDLAPSDIPKNQAPTPPATARTQ